MPADTILIESAAEMLAFGRRIGEGLKAGDVLVLNGELGSGKTTLTRGIGEALGSTDVSSPTFVISKIYSGNIPLVHVDVYRLLGNELALFDDLDLESLIPRSVTVIEWGATLADRLAHEYVTVDISFGSTEHQRIVTITGALL
jgi:tRNA threonylcarbamoyladenosine biosynthesis protein TsaE